MRGELVAALVAGTVLLIGAAAPAGAQDFLRFGPVGEGPAQYNAGYDRSFIREWQANPPKGYPTLSKANLAPTKAAIARYEEIVATGGFPLVPEVELEPGATDPAVAVLRRRLMRSGDLTGDSSYPDHFGSDLDTAVKRFQASNGLAPTGIVDKRTIAALNVPSEVRLTQLKTNLTRLTDLAKIVGKRYVLVNIPAAQVEAVETNAVVSRHSGVVGKPDRPTPLLRSTITDLAFNPMWTLPPTVIKEDLIPKGRDMQQKGESVLVKFGIDAYEGGKKVAPESIDWASGRPTQLSYRQAPGKDNPLGFLKINFANSSSVYMHDSPKESLFGRNFRAASSGCVRVQNIEQLAAWLLTGQGTAEQVEHLKESGQTKTVRLRKPVTLYFAYVTAWATPDGVIQFRPDVYLKDGVGEIAAAY
ncbi:MAG: L,D-transpeptidase family protein [Hyphomicrobium sp.]|uniref:L,D-transpeptidase family protein n=1 Tax=Hyphomicrobium sp. TaxID=82 RepID=UPI00132A5361|nr:L,D-transpeptidase family protein [Hyphomicrobium sp.]KAB2941276.1 MAG: L,D-transpeptidase family protein [Hyphomicrobium sp.]MBZ0209989.1 L,D-transpeptidase family protein [Hyphomicrobium sp.]